MTNQQTQNLNPYSLSSKTVTFLFILSLLFISSQAQNKDYPWLSSYDASEAIEQRIAPPEGFQRTIEGKDSFGSWLRNLPLKAGKPEVKLFNGQLKGNQSAHFAVIDIDTGNRDLQQCADAVMRLKAEYHLACGDHQSIHFNFTSGDKADYSRWKQGYRPKINGNKVSWIKSASASDSYASFRKYMNIVFTYAGTYSLYQEMASVESQNNIRPGDVFIYGGFPGHAIIVMDIAENNETGEIAYLLAQSYMPAQEMHILKNPSDKNMSPWYIAKDGYLRTPEWDFEAGSLKRFKTK